MSSRDEREKIKRATSNEMLTDRFIKELGSKAIVQHIKLDGEQLEYVGKVREVLIDMAMDLQRVNIAPKGFDYMGSLSIHCFSNELMRQFAWVPVNNYGTMTHPISDATLRKLNNDVAEHFTGKRQKLRSGF